MEERSEDAKNTCDKEERKERRKEENDDKEVPPQKRAQGFRKRGKGFKV